MEKENDHHIDQNYRPRILNFNAPLLSTRRPPSNPANSLELLPCSSLRRRNSGSVNDRVPFSWEQAPGKPKDDNRNDNNDTLSHDLNDTPRPKLPPSLLWQYSQNNYDKNKNNDDDGCEADVEDEEDIHDVFSDAVDVFSLSEAIDIVERSEKARESKTDGLTLKIIEDSRSGVNNQYPDFIIQRFLPDATALATASALGAMSLKKSCENYYNCSAGDQAHADHKMRSVSRSITRTTSFSSSKGCGFEMLFPWRVKHKWTCGVKSPIRHSSFSTTTMQLKHKKR